jgi:hypothetical protein
VSACFAIVLSSSNQHFYGAFLKRTSRFAPLSPSPPFAETHSKARNIKPFQRRSSTREVEARRAETSHEARHGKAFAGLLKRYFGA